MSNSADLSATRNPGTSPGADLEQISFYLGRVYYTYVRLLDRTLAQMELDHHLRPGMGNVLFALFEQDDRTISAIAADLQLARSTMTGMVERMRTAGLITTRADRADGRAVRLKLTSLGKSLEPRCRDLALRMDDVLCRKLSPSQRAVTRASLATMLDAMNEELTELNAEAE